MIHAIQTTVCLSIFLYLVLFAFEFVRIFLPVLVIEFWIFFFFRPNFTIAIKIHI